MGGSRLGIRSPSSLSTTSGKSKTTPKWQKNATMIKKMNVSFSQSAKKGQTVELNLPVEQEVLSRLKKKEN